MLNSKTAIDMIAGTVLSSLLLLLAGTYTFVHVPPESDVQLHEFLFGIAFVSLLIISMLLVHFLNRSETASNRLRVQLALTSALAKTSGFDATIEEILESLCKLSGWTVGICWLLKENPEKNSDSAEMSPFYFECRKTWHEDPKSALFTETCRTMRMWSNQGLPGQILRCGKPMWLADVTAEAYFHRAPIARQVGLRAALAFPIMKGTQVCGVVELFSDEKRTPDRVLLELIAAFGSQIGQFIQHEEATALAKLNESRFEQLAENIEDVFWICGPHAVPFHYVSPAYERIWGRSIDEVYQDPGAWLKYVVPEDLEALLPALEKPAPPPVLEYRIIRPDGSIRWMLARNFPVLNEAGETRFCGIMHDVTERKESEKRVREFYSTVSHELRTPLTSIKASLGLVNGGIAGDISPEAGHLLTIASGECDRLVRLINDILDLRKIEAGKIELKLVRVAVSELVSKAIESIRAVAEDQGVSFAVSIQTKGDVDCDMDRVLQVLANLLSNAIKYSPEGQSIEVGVLRKPGGEYRFFVSDSGPGIKQEMIGLLFGKFQQLDSSDSRPREGTGLGLAISKAIVEQHQGKIGVDTKYGEGSTFWFELPGAEDQSDLGETLRLKVLSR